jgi:diketogulonate reductase-like aldo/keto reductase
MEFRSFATLDRQVPIIGQGTWYQPGDDRQSSIDALRVGIDCGMTHIDTAEMYLSGEAETWVGEAIQGQRDKIFLVSKVLPHNASLRGTIKACEGSLERLGTDYLDCYLLHWHGSIPLAETILAFEKLQSEGKIRSWGVSNFNVREIREAKAIKEHYPVCDQVIYHLQERAIEHSVLPFCEQHRIAVVAYSPFGHGDFPNPRSAAGKVLKKVAEKHGATPRQVALRFLLRRPLTFTIVKASDAKHVPENAGAADLKLSDADMAEIDRALPLAEEPAELPVL